jgi:hypothetical protein
VFGRLDRRLAEHVGDGFDSDRLATAVRRFGDQATDGSVEPAD